MTLTALWLQQLAYPAYVDRLLIDTVFQSQGIVATGDFLVSQHAGGATMSVDVAPGVCAIAGTDVAGQQTYLNASDAVFTTPALAAAPGSGQSRIDLIVGHVHDPDAGGGSGNGFFIEIIEGTAATTGSQVAPSMPASSIPLASILVGPLVSSITSGAITDTRVRAVSANLGTDGRTVSTQETTTSTSYTDLATVEKPITVVTGTRAKVTLSFYGGPSGGGVALMSVAVSGATAIAASDANCCRNDGTANVTSTVCFILTGLTAGANTFAPKYRTTTGTATYGNRHTTIEPLL